MGACSYSLASVESATVTYINDGDAVLTEISPQSYCASIASYESMISALVSYVEAHASNPGQYWGGIMLDEEDGFGFSVSSLVTLNQYVSTKMGSTPGISWWYSEWFSGSGVWSQANYNSIVHTYGSYAAPQIATTYMVQLANGCCQPNLVTWSTGYPYPFNSESYADSKINGQPYDHDFYGCSCHVYWDNQFTPA